MQSSILAPRICTQKGVHNKVNNEVALLVSGLYLRAGVTRQVQFQGTQPFKCVHPSLVPVVKKATLHSV